MSITINQANKRQIYSCSEWGARPALHDSPIIKPKNIIIHHMDWPNRMLFQDAHKALETAFHVAFSCQQGHFANGWADTGQNATLTREGLLMEGRHGSVGAIMKGLIVQGAHAADPDAGIFANNTIGLECEGTYSTAQMPPQQWEGLVDFCFWACMKTGLHSQDIIGHCDTGIATECPGKWLHAQIPLLRQAVHLRLTEIQKKP